MSYIHFFIWLNEMGYKLVYNSKENYECLPPYPLKKRKYKFVINRKLVSVIYSTKNWVRNISKEFIDN